MCAGNTGEEGPDGETWSNDEPRVGVDDVCWKHWRAEGPDGVTWSNDEPRVGVDDVCWKHWRGRT